MLTSHGKMVRNYDFFLKKFNCSICLFPTEKIKDMLPSAGNINLISSVGNTFG